MKPEQPAARSNAAAPVAPRLFCTMQAVAGIGMSGVTVAQTIRSTSEAGRPADWSAFSAARVANWDMYSSSRATRRSRMPVRERIQSSDVSTIFSRSRLVRILSGSDDPVPRMTARFSPGIFGSLRGDPVAGRDRRAELAGRRDPDDFLMDPIVHPIAHEVEGDPHGVLDGAHRGAAVADDGRPTHAQERHAS